MRCLLMLYGIQGGLYECKERGSGATLLFALRLGQAARELDQARPADLGHTPRIKCKHPIFGS